MCLPGKKSETGNRSNIVTISIKTLKMVHIKKKKILIPDLTSDSNIQSTLFCVDPITLPPLLDD